MRRNRFVLAVAVFGAAACLASCSRAPEPGPSAAPAPDVATAPLPAPRDEAALREAASTALAAQRIYAPAGSNAIEHYLSLRTLRPDDHALSAALLELLPYAVIGSEQAMERGDFVEARRLVALVRQVDPQFPALVRLSDRIVATELREAQRVAMDAEAEARRHLHRVRHPRSRRPRPRRLQQRHLRPRRQPCLGC